MSQSPEALPDRTSPTDDRPISHPVDDALGYAPFAKHLADTLVRMVPGDGLVIALYGPWGSGKTTILNLVEHYLASNAAAKLSIMHFNPWWFSTPEDLVQSFLGQLLEAFERGKRLSAKARKNIGELLAAIGGAPFVPGWLAWLPKLLGRQLGKARDLHALRAALETELRNQPGRTLVIIDDVDRLTPVEIRHLFRLVKAVGNLPRVTYLVAFDRKVVVEALDDAHPGFGLQYLEKIVQVPFEIPPPDPISLRSMLFEKLDHVLGEESERKFDHIAWGNIFIGGIQHFIRTPRHAVQLSNTLAVSYPAVRGEVHTVDFLAIESLKVFAPDVYEVMRSNPEAFSGVADGRDSSVREDKAFYDGVLESARKEHRDAVKEILQRVFPRCQAAWGGSSYGEEWSSSWRRDKRACAPDLLPVYFQLQIPKGAISSKDLEDAVEAASDRTQFATLLSRLSKDVRPDGKSKAHALLARLEDFTDSGVPTESIPSMFLGLLDSADAIERAEPDRGGFFDFGVHIQVRRILFQLLRRLPQATRIELLRRAATTSPNLSMLTHEIVDLGRQHEKYGAKREPGQPDPLLPLADVEDLERLMVERFRSAADDGRLRQAQDLPWLLHAWCRWDEPACRAWIDASIDDPQFVISFLNGALKVGFRHTMGDHVSSKQYMIDLDFIRPLFDPERMEASARTLLADQGLGARERIAVERFLEELSKPRNPDGGAAA